MDVQYHKIVFYASKKLHFISSLKSICPCKFWLILSFLILIFAAPILGQNSAKYSDCHFHLLNFLQNGEFWNSDNKFPGSEWGLAPSARYSTLPYGERGRRIEALIKGMDLAEVDHIMIFGIPFLKKWSENEPFMRPKYYLDSSSQVKPARDTDITVASALIDYRMKYAKDEEKLAQLDRIHPYVCGFDITDMGAVDLIVKRIKEFPDVWEGIGEVMSRHDDLTNLSMGDRPRANHPAMKRVCRFAGQHFLPVSIHHNIAPISRSQQEIKQPYYLDELTELIEYSRWEKDGEEYNTTFIWCHSGASRRVVVDSLDYWVEEVLDAYGDQLYIDLSWVVLEDYINPNQEKWINLIEKYPKKFMIGSDAVGKSSSIKKEMNRYDELLAALPEDVSYKVASGNFISLMEKMKQKRSECNLGDRGIVLDYDYEFPEFESTGRLSDEDSFTRSRILGLEK